MAKRRYAARIAKIEAAAKKAGVVLPPGASEAAIAAAEAKLGVAFPAEVRAFYLAHDGGPKNALVLGGRLGLLSIEAIVEQWAMWKGLLDDEELGDDDEAEPERGIQQRWWIPAWVPVTYDFGGNHCAIDFAPANGGKRGQIIEFWHDDGSRTLEGGDFLSWLEKQTWTGSSM